MGEGGTPPLDVDVVVVGARCAGVEAILLDPLCAWPHIDCVKVKDLFEIPGLLLAND